jgi:hypothetical protein
VFATASAAAGDRLRQGADTVKRLL